MTSHESTDLIYWHEAFLVLAIKRHASILDEIGIPHQIAAAPEHALVISREFLRRCFLDVLDEHVDFAYKQLSEALSALDTYYGSAAKAYLAWCRRQVIDRDVAHNWNDWGSALSYLAYSIEDGRSIVALPFAESVTSRLVSEICLRYGHRRSDADAAKLSAIRDIPLSDVEKELLTPATERRSLTDMEPSLSNLMKTQQAFDIWSDLKKWMTPVQLQDLLGWARSMLALMGRPNTAIKIPSLDE